MVFLHGGLDSLGLIVPSSGTPERYKNIRQHLAYEQEELIEFGLAGYGALEFCQNMKPLPKRKNWPGSVMLARFDNTTKAMIERNGNVMPIFIGSHNSQVILAQSASMDPNARNGWGRMLERCTPTFSNHRQYLVGRIKLSPVR